MFYVDGMCETDRLQGHDQVVTQEQRNYDMIDVIDNIDTIDSISSKRIDT